MAQDGHIPTVYNYNLGIQHQLPFRLLLDVAYVGSLSNHLTQQLPLNDPAFGSAWLPQYQDPTVPPKYDGTTTLPVNFLRPYTGYGSIAQYTFDGNSNYNALQVSANRRFSNQLSFGLAYTWSKALGTSGSNNQAVNPLNRRMANYGPLSFDATQSFVVNYVYNLPTPFKSNAVARLVLGGWAISGITTLSSGFPLNPSFSINNVSGAALNRQLTGSEPQAARVVLSGNPNLSPGDRTVYAWINTSAIHPAAKGSTGWDSGTNPVRGPGINNWDMTFYKRFYFTKSEERFIQIRLETYNTFNHTQWSGINLNANFNSSGQITNLPTAVGGGGGRFGFGAVNAVRSSRKIQFSARINF
jgi:hypothetical protein